PAFAHGAPSVFPPSAFFLGRGTAPRSGGYLGGQLGAAPYNRDGMSPLQRSPNGNPCAAPHASPKGGCCSPQGRQQRNGTVSFVSRHRDRRSLYRIADRFSPE